MDKKHVFVKAVFGVAIIFILAAAIILIKDNNRSLTGSVVVEPAKTFNADDSVSISNDELVKCCTFQNSEGKDDACFILKRYDCSYCDIFCRKE